MTSLSPRRSMYQVGDRIRFRGPLGDYHTEWIIGRAVAMTGWMWVTINAQGIMCVHTDTYLDEDVEILQWSRL